MLRVKLLGTIDAVWNALRALETFAQMEDEKSCMTSSQRRARIAVLWLLLTLPSGAPVQAAQGEYVPKSGQPGKDIVWVPTPAVMVDKLLDMAAITSQDYVVDLGSGDGRNVIAAAKRGARAHGIEYDADLVALSKRQAAKEGVADKATFEQADLFVADFSKATVIILFLTPEMNIRLRPKLLDLKPGARIVANSFAIGDWNADRTSVVTANCERWCTARLWIVPARVAGRWRLPQGELVLKQTYQTFSGTMIGPKGSAPLVGRLRGENIFFAAGKTRFTGRVDGDLIKGFARESGQDSEFRAKRIGN
jgi:SAM-dependent methyltransferase